MSKIVWVVAAIVSLVALAVALVVLPDTGMWIFVGLWGSIAIGSVVRAFRKRTGPPAQEPGRDALAAYEANYLNRPPQRIQWPLDTEPTTSVVDDLCRRRPRRRRHPGQPDHRGSDRPETTRPAPETSRPLNPSLTAQRPQVATAMTMLTARKHVTNTVSRTRHGEKWRSVRVRWAPKARASIASATRSACRMAEASSGTM